MPAWKTKCLRGPWKRLALSAKRCLEAVVERQHIVRLGLLPPQIDHRLELARARFSARSSVSLKSRSRWKSSHLSLSKSPPSGWNATAFQPSLHQAAMAEHLEILRRRFRRRLRILETGGEARAFERHLRDAVDGRRRLDADDVEQGRHEIAGVAELVAQLAARGNALGPGDHQRIADAAAMGVLLVALAAACSTPSPSRAESSSACRARRYRRCARSSPRSARGAGCRGPWR